MRDFTREVKEWVVNDYFTPNVKAEVILDTLLTPYVRDILKDRRGGFVGELHFITKEMSLEDIEGVEQSSKGDRGAKIDYVLADGQFVYLVELKTTPSSLDGEQTSRYQQIAGRKFGETLGKRLLSILKKNFNISLDENDGDLLEQAWKKIWEKRASYDPADKVPEEAEDHASTAINFIREKGWAWRGRQRSRKYLLTLGQILDYYRDSGSGSAELWEKILVPVYLMPRDKDQLGAVEFVPYILSRHKGTALAEIIKEIYGEEVPCQS